MLAFANMAYKRKNVRKKILFFDEVSAVDKYEYKVNTEQMHELMEDGACKRVAEMADESD